MVGMCGGLPRSPAIDAVTMTLPERLRDEGALADLLGQEEHAVDIEVDDLHPGLEGVILGRCPPARAGVVHQDVDPAVVV
jgi:hypothetical protein